MISDKYYTRKKYCTGRNQERGKMKVEALLKGCSWSAPQWKGRTLRGGRDGNLTNNSISKSKIC